MVVLKSETKKKRFCRNKSVESATSVKGACFIVCCCVVRAPEQCVGFAAPYFAVLPFVFYSAYFDVVFLGNVKICVSAQGKWPYLVSICAVYIWRCRNFRADFLNVRKCGCGCATCPKKRKCGECEKAKLFFSWEFLIDLFKLEKKGGFHIPLYNLSKNK